MMTEFEPGGTTSPDETTTAGLVGDIFPEYDELSQPQQGSQQKDVEDSDITTEFAIEQDENTDESAVSEMENIMAIVELVNEQDEQNGQATEVTTENYIASRRYL